MAKKYPKRAVTENETSAKSEYMALGPIQKVRIVVYWVLSDIFVGGLAEEGSGAVGSLQCWGQHFHNYLSQILLKYVG